MMSMTVAFAGNGEKDNAKAVKAAEAAVLDNNQNYDMSVNYDRLASVLGLNSYQEKAMKLIHNQFVDEMKNAGEANSADRKALVEKATGKELKYMSYVLDGDQYDKFDMLLNLTLNNRGLLK